MTANHEPLPLGLSMLWESVEPESALTERFGFNSFDEAANWVAGVLDQTWGLDVVRCLRLVISDQNAIVWAESTTGDFIVKWSRAQEKFANLDASTRLLRTLATDGIPVAPPVPTREGSDRTVLQGPAGPLSTTVVFGQQNLPAFKCVNLQW